MAHAPINSPRDALNKECKDCCFYGGDTTPDENIDALPYKKIFTERVNWAITDPETLA